MQMREIMLTLDDFGSGKLMQSTQQTIKKQIWKISGDNIQESGYTKINAVNTSARRIANAGL